MTDQVIDVTDEEYAEICKYDLWKAPKEDLLCDRTSANSAARGIATFCLVVGIIVDIILVFYTLSEEEYASLWIAIVLLLSLILWRALILVFCEIAESLRRIENKTQK